MIVKGFEQNIKNLVQIIEFEDIIVLLLVSTVPRSVLDVLASVAIV